MTDELRYSKDHEWVRLDDAGHAVIGVTDFAAGQLGDVVYDDLREAGEEIKSGTEMGEIESTKSVSDLFSPVDGAVDRGEQVGDGPGGLDLAHLGAGLDLLPRLAQVVVDHVAELAGREVGHADHGVAGVVQAHPLVVLAVAELIGHVRSFQVRVEVQDRE